MPVDMVFWGETLMQQHPVQPQLTVVICTYNRAYILGECLQSLQQQTVPTCFFNVIVADNNSTDNTQALLKDFTHGWPQLKIIVENKQGAGSARNAALKEVTTDWVACLDSDGKAHPNWLAEIFETIKKDDFDAFGGPYYAWHFFGPPPKWFPKKFGTYEAAQGYGPLQRDSYIPGGSCAFKLSTAKAVGNFPTNIGMTGNKCAYGEETVMFNRMHDAGFRLGYVPNMKIDHCVLPYKYSFIWQMKSFYARGQSYQEITTHGVHWFKNLLGIGARLVFSFGKLILLAGNGLVHGWRSDHQQRVVKIATKVAFHTGQLVAAISLFFTMAGKND